MEHFQDINPAAHPSLLFPQEVYPQKESYFLFVSVLVKRQSVTLDWHRLCGLRAIKA